MLSVVPTFKIHTGGISMLMLKILILFRRYNALEFQIFVVSN